MLINVILIAAKIPDIKAPTENGRLIRCAIATPGTIECAKASPIKDHPFKIKKHDKRAVGIEIINEIKKIYDPEIPVNIYELGEK